MSDLEEIKVQAQGEIEKLASKKTANDLNSHINKNLRAWTC